jgi:hypothetical protein
MGVGGQSRNSMLLISGLPHWASYARLFVPTLCFALLVACAQHKQDQKLTVQLLQVLHPKISKIKTAYAAVAPSPDNDALETPLSHGAMPFRYPNYCLPPASQNEKPIRQDGNITDVLGGRFVQVHKGGRTAALKEISRAC